MCLNILLLLLQLLLLLLCICRVQRRWVVCGVPGFAGGVCRV